MVLLNGACTIRTPERILQQQFRFRLKGFDYQVETFEEQWCPNGDGNVLIVFKLKELTQKNIHYIQSLGMKKLPMNENSEIPDFLYVDSGYYSFENEDINDERDFKLLIIDTDKKKITLYYQYM